jgi:hypothetical protein
VFSGSETGIRLPPRTKEMPRVRPIGIPKQSKPPGECLKEAQVMLKPGVARSNPLFLNQENDNVSIE